MRATIYAERKTEKAISYGKKVQLIKEILEIICRTAKENISGQTVEFMTAIG